MRLRITFLLVFIAVLSNLTHMSYAVQGTVTNTSGDPVSGALVTFTDESDSDSYFYDYTDEAGRYEINVAPVDIEEKTPTPFSLGQNYPNPFNPSTTIPFTLDTTGYVQLSIYNITGQKIATLLNDYYSPGQHTVKWDGHDDNNGNVSAGLYLYTLSFGNQIDTRKMLLLDGGSDNTADSGTHNTLHFGKQVVSKKAEGTTYTVTIAHDAIIPYNNTGIIVTEEKTLDFVVIGITVFKDLSFVTIPGGTFRMGDVEEVGHNWENPVHSVTISSFEMCIYKVTNTQYATYLNEALASEDITVNSSEAKGTTGDWSGQQYIDLSGSNDSNNKCWISYSAGSFIVEEGREDWPVVHVTWYGSKAFAEHYGLDLAREAEWEYTCRGGNQYKYGTDDGTISSDNANYNLNVGHPIAVGSYPANPFGLFDMSGNTWEWCGDWYGDYSDENATDPTGVETGSGRVIRGGSWYHSTDYCRSAYRDYAPPEFSRGDIGFRVVRR